MIWPENLRLRPSQFTYGDRLLLCFILGVLGGTAAALFFGDRLLQELILGAAGNMGPGRGRRVVGQRLLETGLGWMAGLTVCSQALFGALVFGWGISLSVVLSVLTMEKGLLGILYFLGCILPHGAVYVFVWYVLAGWAGQRQKRVRLLSGTVLLAITGAGAALEVYVGSLMYRFF